MSLPGNMVPGSAAGDISEHHITLSTCLLQRLLQLNESRVDTKLQNSVDAMVRLFFQFLQSIEVPGVDHQRFFTDHIRPHPQSQTAMCIVQIIGGANGYVVNSILLGTAAQLLQVAVEAFDLREELNIEEILIEYTDRVLRIHSRHQLIAGISNSTQMTGSNITANTDHSKVF